MKTVIFTLEVTTLLRDDVDPEDVTFELPMDKAYPAAGGNRVGTITSYCTQPDFEEIKGSAHATSQMTHEEWMGEVYNSVEALGHVDRSDAQGIADAHLGELDRYWSSGINPATAAQMILEQPRKAGGAK